MPATKQIGSNKQYGYACFNNWAGTGVLTLFAIGATGIVAAFYIRDHHYPGDPPSTIPGPFAWFGLLAMVFWIDGLWLFWLTRMIREKVTVTEHGFEWTSGWGKRSTVAFNEMKSLTFRNARMGGNTSSPIQTYTLQGKSGRIKFDTTIVGFKDLLDTIQARYSERHQDEIYN